MRKLVRFLPVFAALSAATVGAAPRPAPKLPPVSLADLAGEYYEGTGLYGTVLTLDRRGRFRFTTSRDNLGVPEKHNRGTARLVDGMLLLKPLTVKPVDEKWETLRTHYQPVRWGKRRYLAYGGDRGLLDFCNDINLGYEPRTFGSGLNRRREDRRQRSALAAAKMEGLHSPGPRELPGHRARGGRYGHRQRWPRRRAPRRNDPPPPQELAPLQDHHRHRRLHCRCRREPRHPVPPGTLGPHCRGRRFFHPQARSAEAEVDPYRT